MRKYRLVFASAATVPDGGALYGRLWGLMQEQKKGLGITTEAIDVASPLNDLAVSQDKFQTGSVWSSDSKNDSTSLTVLARKDGRFRAQLDRFGQKRDIDGAVEGNQIVWSEVGVKRKDGRGFSDYGYSGEISGGRMVLHWKGHNQSGSYTLTLKAQDLAK